MNDIAAELNDPNTPAERLAALAAQHPEYGAQIAAHPNAYDGLREWIAQYAATAASQQAQQAQHAQQAQQAQEAYAAQQTAAFRGDPQHHAPVQHPQYAGQQHQLHPQYATPQHPQYATPQHPQAQPLQDAGARPPRKRTALIVTLSAVLVVLLALGGGAWWFFSTKLGGASSPEAAASKLIGSASNLDALALYGSFAPSEFKAFEPAAQNLLSTPTDTDSGSAEQLIAELKREVRVTTAVPIVTETDVLVDGAVARVSFVEGVVEIDGDPAAISRTVIDFYGPILQQQSEAYGYTFSESDLAAAQRDFEDDLAGNLPYTIDFRDFDAAVVTVREGSGWFVSPLMTIADYSHRYGGDGDDRVLGNTIAEPAKDGAASPEAAAERMTRALADGDYRAVLAELPLPERRLLSVYGPAFGAEDRLASAVEELGLELEAAEFASSATGDSARISIEDLTFSSTRYERGYDLSQRVRISGVCFDAEGEELRYIDYYTDDWDYLWQRFLRTPGVYDFDRYLENLGYEQFEVISFEEGFCLDDRIPALRQLGVNDVAIVALKEGGTWKISPLGTLADISTIISTRLSEAAANGDLDSLFR